MQQNELKKKNLSCMVILLLKMHHSLYYKTLWIEIINFS